MATPAAPDELMFVEEEPASRSTAVSVDLKSALEVNWEERLDRLDAVLAAESADRTSLVRAQLKALVQAGRELAGSGSLEKLFELILDLSLDAVNASRGVVITRDSDGTLKPHAIRGEGLRISTAIRDAVLNEGRSLLIRDARLDQNFGSRGAIVAQEVRSILAVPLQTDERVIGLLYLDSPRQVLEFTPEDLNLVTVLANIAAIRIEHARLMEQVQAKKLMAAELERAAEIQRRLLPSAPPGVTGFDIAAYNKACYTVGGDYYDFLSYPDGRVVLLIGDVSGKGMGAALLMSGLQARAHVLFENPDPFVEQVRRLNRSVAAHFPPNCFITFFAALLDPVTGELHYCNAGHNPPLLLRGNGELELLDATGFPLGIKRDTEYEEKKCRLAPGDMLVLFSDGVTEAWAPDGDQEFGERRLLAALKSKRDGSAAALIEAVTADLLAFTAGSPPADDITLVIARRRPEPIRLS